MPKGTPWTDDQIRRTIAVYFEMVRSAASGQVVRPRSLRELHVARIGRSVGLEFALLNVSAALKKSGYPYLTQLEPRDRVGQKRLAELVAEHLESDPEDASVLRSLGS